MESSRKLKLEKYIIIGNSIKNNNSKAINNILSDTIESIIGAIFIDGGIKNTKKFIENHLLSNIQKFILNNQNYKGLLIEQCHKLNYSEPSFKHIEVLKFNKKCFKVSLTINQKKYTATSSTKKNAEFKVSKKALLDLNN